MGRRYARRLVGCEADCDEIVQEVFCRLLARSQAQHSETGLRGLLEADVVTVDADRSRWIGLFIRSIRNMCIDRLRQRQVRTASSLPIECLGAEAPTHPLIRSEEHERLCDALEELPENWRIALQLRVEEELGYDAIAARMSATKAQVRTWIFRGRRQLAQALGE
jgi:RNA polymerase sigma factor (sigma-70 family)